MYSDDVMEEIWKIKDQRAARYGHDVRLLVRALQAEEEKNGHRLVQLPRERNLDRPVIAPS